MSGLKVNFFKSKIFGIRVNEDCLQMLADLLGCKAGTLPSSYLGLPVCIGAISKSIWYPVIERLEKKLALWKANHLSLAGRITLINAALANLPIYFMSLYKCPTEVNKRIGKLQRDFLWQGKENKKKFHLIKWSQVWKPRHGHGKENKKKFHLIKWSQVCKPRQDDGLAIRP